MRLTEEQQLNAEYNRGKHDGYIEGYKHAVWLFAWWKDGVQYVGSGKRTLKEASEDAEDQWTDYH